MRKFCAFMGLMAVLVFITALMISGCSQNPSGTVDEQLSTENTDALFSRPSAYGNCLSVPVIFAEGHGLTGEDPTHFTGLRGTPGVESFVEPYNSTLIDGYPVYKNPSVNEWCGDWADGTTWGQVQVEADWADNMTRQTWAANSKVRVEVVLFANVDPIAHPLTAYRMYSLGGTQLNEVFVTNTVKYTTDLATVYSNVARLKIVKLGGKGGNPILDVYDSACYEGYFIDGPTDAYSGEVNMGGKCIYGYNWDVSDVPLADKTGWYRITFSLDPGASYADVDGTVHSYPRNTHIAGLNPGDMLGTNDPEVVVYPPTLGEDGFSTDLEIEIKASKGGGKKPNRP